MTKRTRIGIRCGVGLVAMALSYNAARAQVLYGTLTGNVTDPAGAVVPKVHVEATSQDTNIKRETETDDHGIYRFNDLQPGLYQVAVNAVSFKKFTETNVQVQANAVIRIDVHLQIASATESIEISADSVVLQTDRSDIHTEISATEVEQLPYNGTEGKNFQSLVCCCSRAPPLLPEPVKPTRRPEIRSAPSRSFKTAFLRRPITLGWTVR